MRFVATCVLKEGMVLAKDVDQLSPENVFFKPVFRS